MMPLWTHHLLAILSFVLTLMFVSSILRSRLPPGSTIAWLLMICLLPYLGITLYLIFSGRKFKTRLNQKVSLYAATKDKVRNQSPIQRILRSSGVPNAKSNQRIELLPTGVAAFDRLTKLIQSAQKSVHITTFIFGNDNVGKALVEELTKRATAGVDVRILLDSVGAAMVSHPSFASFKRAGGKTAYFMPILHLPFRGRTNLRNHRKLMVVDGKIAVLGGMNLAEEYLGPTDVSTRWVDLGATIEGDCVPDIEDIFLQDWAFATRSKDRAFSETSNSPRDQHVAQVVASGPDVPNDPLYDVLLSAINEAKNQVRVVTPYFIPDESLTKALELASKRGVNVDILIPRKSNHRLADWARGSFIRQLDAAGVHFSYYPRMIHAKAIMVDRSLAILGSANFDMRSLLLNYELGLIIYSDDTLKAVEEWLLKRQIEASPLTIKAAYWTELVEGIGRVLGPLL